MYKTKLEISKAISLDPQKRQSSEWSNNVF